MASVSEVTVKYAARGAKEAQRADKNVRSSIKETAQTARKESGTISQWMQSHKTALLAIGAATAAAMGMIIKASPELSAQLSSVRLGFSLLAMTIGSDLAPATEGIGQTVIDLADAFAGLDSSIRKPISAIVSLAGIVGVLIPVIAGLETLLAGTAIGGALASAASTAAGALGSLVAFLGGPVTLVILAIIALAVGLYLAWKTNFLGIRDITASVLGFIQAKAAAVVAFLMGLWSSLVSFMLPLIKSLWATFVTSFNGIKQAVMGAFNLVRSIIKTVLGAVRGFIQTTLAKLSQLWALHGTAIKQEVRETFAAIRGYIQPVLNFLKVIIRATFAIIETVIKTTFGVIEGIIRATTAVIRKIWRKFGDEIMTVIRTALAIVRTIIVTAFDAIMTAIRVALNIIQGDWEEAWSAIEGFLSRTKKRLLSLVDNIISGVKEKFTGMADDAMGWGKDIMNNFISGIRSKISEATDIASNVADSVKEHLSFDRVQNDRMAQRWGSDLVEHFAKGMNQNRNSLSAALPQQERGAFGMAPATSPGAGGGGGSTTIEITIEEGAIQMRGSGSSAIDSDRLAEQVSSEISSQFGRR
jgi:phage-related protein